MKRSRRYQRHLFAVIIVTIVAVVMGAGLLQLRIMHDLEDVTADIRMLAFAPETTPSNDIVIVALDDATMNALPYRSPIPRDFLARLHREIMRAKPLIVGYDIFFQDPSFPDADQALANAFEDTAVYGVVPMRQDGVLERVLPRFEEVLSGVGLADLPQSAFDATVRRARLRLQTREGPYPSFAAVLATAAVGDSAEEMMRDEARAPGWGPFATTPFTAPEEFRIRFVGAPSAPSFSTYSASLVAKGLIPAAWLAGKIVLVGATASDLKDLFATPYFARATQYARMSGVELHANVLSSLLTGQFYYELRWWQGLVIAFVAACFAAAAALVLAPWRAAIVMSVEVLLVIGLAILAFREASLVLPVVQPLASLTMASVLGVAWNALTEGRERRFITRAFAQYVPAPVVERLCEQPELLQLGGEQREVTSFFSDIASFTSISERLDPATLVEFLNDYLGCMNAELFQYGATLDKYEGDAIIAFWNAPVEVADHPRAAVLAALGVQRAGHVITKQWKDRCGREIVTRIGLNTGLAVVGNMGSEGRFDYTAIGDTINLASRLEGANKFYGTKVLAAESLVKRISTDEFALRPVDLVRVKGKSVPVRLYEIVGIRSEIDRDRLVRVLEPCNDAFECLMQRGVHEARALLAQAASVAPDDGVVAALLARCDRIEQELQWDLVTEFSSK